MIDYRVYLVTDDPSRYRGNWLDNVVAAVEGGVTCVQYRDTESPPKAQYARLLQLRDALRRSDAALVVNNDASLARAVGAHGLHVGQGDMPLEAARAIVGLGVEIGLSITAKEQVAVACAAGRLGRAGGADCLGIGPVYDARKTKADAAAAMGPAGLSAVVGEVGRLVAPHPCGLVAIGGITLENAETVLAAGAHGLAVVSAFSKADDPYDVARRFASLYDEKGGFR